MDYKLEVVAVAVDDVDAAKAFYERIGYHVDHDHRVRDGLRFVQITPPGSCCSIVIGKGITSAPPGSAQGLQVVVDDVEAAQAQLRDAGVEIGDVQDSPAGRFVFFNDPDGNGWAVQQFPAPSSFPPATNRRQPPTEALRWTNSRSQPTAAGGYSDPR